MFNKSLILAVDMYGCPNRCRHCWIGHMLNKQIDKDADALNAAKNITIKTLVE